MAVAKKKKPAAAPAPEKKARAKPKARPKPKSRQKATEPSGIWHWKTPDESAKLRFAFGLVVILLTAVTLASGEVRSYNGTWRAGFRNLQGHFVLGLEWSRGEWPRRWVAR
ncbi:hypothetical protein JST97_33360 [bacterium]|nr:hypothetical protein [bacterium]